MQEEVAVLTQGYFFLVTLGLGGMMGIFFDFYRASRYFWRPSRYITFFLDVAFSILITALVFLGLLASNWGEVRSYVFAGLLLGLLFYYLFLSRYFLAAGRIFWGTFYYMISLFLFFLAKILRIVLTLLKIFFAPFLFFGFALKKIYPKADKKIRAFLSYVRLITKRGRNFFQKRK